VVSWKSGLFLLAVLVGLGVYAYASRPQPAPPGPAFVPCGLLETTSIKIQGPTRALEIVRQTPSDPWQILQPVKAAGDPTAISSLVAAIDSVKVLNTIKNVQPPATYGLDQPREVLTCRLTSGASFTLSIGNQSFDSSGYYAQKGADSRVYVISSVEVDSFDRVLAEPPVQPTPGPSPSA